MPTARYTLPLPADEPTEVVIARLHAAGALGTWQRPDAIVAWFDDEDAEVPPGGSWELEPERDWQEDWKAGIGPVRAGRVLVVPSWLDAATPDAADEVRLVLDPGGAFGSGHHATTVLCLEALQRDDLGGRTVLDVGTGTGILALAAARLGAGRVIGLDVDGEAVAVARANADRLGIDVELIVGSLDEVDVQADHVVANLLTGTLVQLAEPLVAATVAGGRLTVSGVASERADRVAAALRAAGLDAIDTQHRDGWAMLTGTRPGAPT